MNEAIRLDEFSDGELEVLTQLGPGSIVPIELTRNLAVFALRISRANARLTEQVEERGKDVDLMTDRWLTAQKALMDLRAANP